MCCDAAEDIVVLVTGGSGLVGQALKQVVEEEKRKEKWIFLSSKDGDLRFGPRSDLGSLFAQQQSRANTRHFPQISTNACYSSCCFCWRPIPQYEGWFCCFAVCCACVFCSTCYLHFKQYPVEFWTKNTDINENVLRCCAETKKSVSCQFCACSCVVCSCVRDHCV